MGYKTTIVPITLYGCETWSLTLREEQRLRVFENRLLRRILNLRGKKWREAGEDFTLRSFLTCTFHQISLEWSN